MDHIVKILKIERLSENIKKFIVEKPKDYNFVSGQHTAISLDGKIRLFSFSSPANAENLEFIIKIYRERGGFTKKIGKLKTGDELIIGEPKGKISYKGCGIFIAAGTGINPFLSIIKSLKKNEIKNNCLIYINKTQKDIILEKELKALFENSVFILSREKKHGYEHGHIDKQSLKNKIKNFSQKFYVCGPVKFVSDVKKWLIELGTNKEDIVSEI